MSSPALGFASSSFEGLEFCLAEISLGAQ